MRTLGPEQLRTLALDAIEEAAAAAHAGPVRRTKGLALAIAWLLHFGKPGETLPRWPFETFWEGLENTRHHDRWGSLNAAVNAIYRALDLQRDMARVSKFEAEARHSQIASG